MRTAEASWNSDYCYRNFEFPLVFGGRVRYQLDSKSASAIFMKILIQKSTRITSTGTGTSTRITCLLEDGIG